VYGWLRPHHAVIMPGVPVPVEVASWTEDIAALESLGVDHVFIQFDPGTTADEILQAMADLGVRARRDDPRTTVSGTHQTTSRGRLSTHGFPHRS
jgi:hypothetical protein